MALNFNMVQLAGRLCSDPELKTTTSGLSTVRFRLAVNRRGENQQADFFTVVAWRQTAEFICKYFRKGSSIMIDGEAHVNSWEAKDGVKHNDVEFVVNHAYFVEGRQEGGFQPVQAQNTTPPTSTSVYTAQPAQPVNPYTDGATQGFEPIALDGDDLPF